VRQQFKISRSSLLYNVLLFYRGEQLSSVSWLSMFFFSNWLQGRSSFSMHGIAVCLCMIGWLPLRGCAVSAWILRSARSSCWILADSSWLEELFGCSPCLASLVKLLNSGCGLTAGSLVLMLSLKSAGLGAGFVWLVLVQPSGGMSL
jgi:hypothetical protein